MTMRIKKFTALIIGSLFAFSAPGCVLAGDVALVTAAYSDIHDSFQSDEEFNRAVRAEHARHARQVEEIRNAHHSDAGTEDLDREMGRERERHERILREIHEEFHPRDTHLVQYQL